jgi:CobQ-like glutamine amidotransferase family enzyme
MTTKIAPAVVDLRIGHLYPDLMSIYGDRGNVLALTQRAKWRGIDVETRAFTAGGRWDPDWADVYFFGGGQDQGQDIVGADLAGANGDALKRSIEGGAAVFSVCGGYQLLGREYVPEVGEAIPGLGVLDVTTRAGKVRFVGNLLAKTEDGKTLIGFENHSGYTYLGPQAKPLGRVIAGHGNNGADKTEGAVQGKIIGCYLHGSALPKNPWLADQLISWGLARRHGSVELASLDDAEEIAAQISAAEVAKTRT